VTAVANMKDELFGQHREAEVLFERLAAAGAELRRSGGPEPGVMATLAELRAGIQGEVMGHFREEEQALFPVLGRHLDVAEGPIAMLMEEHAHFRELELEFEAGLAALESGAAGEWVERLAAAVEAMCGLMPGHIEKEDAVLFPIAESVLSDVEWAEAERLWQRARAAAGLPA
jgi:iron-sulfur cluster repair protein YtfE (RIC family)